MNPSVAELEGLRKDAGRLAQAVSDTFAEPGVSEDGLMECAHCSATYPFAHGWETCIHKPECVVNLANSYIDAAIAQEGGQHE